MKIENTKRILEAIDELEALNTAIENMSKYNGKAALIISEYASKNGFYLGHQWKNGNSHPMYPEIFKFIKSKFEEARNDLIKEIEEL